MNICLASAFANWVGRLVKPNTKMIVVTDPGKEKDTLLRLSRIGFSDTVIGVLEGGVKDWKDSGFPVEKWDFV